jgi:hypothetical protein
VSQFRGFKTDGLGGIGAASDGDLVGTLAVLGAVEVRLFCLGIIGWLVFLGTVRADVMWFFLPDKSLTSSNFDLQIK